MVTPKRTEVLVIGAGGAGMYAAIAAARAGRDVLLLDKSLIGRGGATIMAQMTVSAAIGHAEPDDPDLHYADTLRAGRGLCNPALARALCADGPARILEMDAWGAGWARQADGRLAQVHAPGHSRRRCVYVDPLNTGPAVARTLQARVAQEARVRRVSNLVVTDLVVRDGCCLGAVAVDLNTGEPRHFHAAATVLAAGGLTRLFRRNSASANMTGDAYALALRAGAALVDMEFVQFFPIAHLAPRLVGMDPIMWDPFRYKLGGRLLNGEMAEFLDRYGSSDAGQYVATRDVVSHAILAEVAAGRGSPHGGAYLDFRHVPDASLRAAFGPVIDRLLKNGIDLTQTPVEVSPMAHYHMGGIRCDTQMATGLPGLYAAGEAVGGAHGANRLSGNAITEAFVFGERAGRAAAAWVQQAGLTAWDGALAAELAAVPQRPLAVGRAAAAHKGAGAGGSPAQLIATLQALMADQVGPVRTGAGLEQALEQIRAWQRHLSEIGAADVHPFNTDLLDWLDLRNLLATAEAVTAAALARQESRGAHFRTDFPESREQATANVVLRRCGAALDLRWTPLEEVRV